MAKDSEIKRRVFVGIAASAGGLEAASSLVKNLPASTNAVYVLAQHMSPTHKSLLGNLLSRETSLPVVELGDDETDPEPGNIYITPPNRDVIVRDGKLVILEPSNHPAVAKPSADRLFNSLVEECGPACVAIVLSGTGKDGSYGVQAIREVGGITIAQDPTTAKYNGMPSAAINTGCIDVTMSPEKIGTHLQRILEEPNFLAELKESHVDPEHSYSLMQILLARTNIDFRDYKEATINRRIARRMVALGIEDYEAYVEYCRGSVEEVDHLHRDLLISVTRFFRDRSQFEKLRREIFEAFRNRTRSQIRVWVAGCATGEEAYSVAILIAEALGGVDQLEKNRVQVFATDVDERALEIARVGAYPISAAHDIPADYLARYFTVTKGSLEVVRELHSVVLFSKHNICQDPPFIDVDVLSLRNVLIYFNRALQERVLARAHFAMNDSAMLFLGTSESIGTLDQLFETRNGNEKIYSKRLVSRTDPNIMTAAMSNSMPVHSRSAEIVRGRPSSASETDNEMFDALARTVAPNGLIITRQHTIVRVFGEVTALLELNESSTLSLSTRILRQGLREEAQSLISFAFKNKKKLEGRWHQIEGPGFNTARMVCYPIMTASGEDHMLIALETRMEEDQASPVESLSDKERTQYILQIETEMQSTREALQQTVEELQTSNEELQSLNEEMQSSNEEMQSTNEELETANEELQSTNEELITVNEEMQVNTAELQTTYMEMTAVLMAAPYPVMVVDHALIVRRASGAALSYFGLDAGALTGRHLSQCVLKPGFPVLTSLAVEVFKSRERSVAKVGSEVDQGVDSVVFAPFYDNLHNLTGLTISVYGPRFMETVI